MPKLKSTLQHPRGQMAVIIRRIFAAGQTTRSDGIIHAEMHLPKDIRPIN